MKILSLLPFLIVSIASCATIPAESVNRGKPVSISDKVNCFGLDVPIRFHASETFGAGYFGRSFNVSTLFGILHPDRFSNEVVYAKIFLDSAGPVVGIRYFNAQDQVIHQITRYKAPRIIDCAENRTEISFTDFVAGDGARESRLITLTFTQNKEFVRVDSRMEKTHCTLLFCRAGEREEYGGNFKLYGSQISR